jgi:hypothetical protein
MSSDGAATHLRQFGRFGKIRFQAFKLFFTVDIIVLIRLRYGQRQKHFGKTLDEFLEFENVLAGLLSQRLLIVWIGEMPRTEIQEMLIQWSENRFVKQL